MFKLIKKIFLVIKYLSPAICIFLICLYGGYFDLNNKTTSLNKEIVVEYNKTFNSDVFITNQFSDKEKEIIEQAAIEWNQKTKGLVNLNVKFEPFKELNFNNGIIIIKTFEYDPDIMVIDSISNCYCTLGLTITDHPVPNIKIVEYRVEGEDHFYSAVLHELGHYIGLSHNTDWKDINTLMYTHLMPSVRKEITRKDLKKFCDIYNCDVFKREEILNGAQSYQIYLP